MKYGLSLNMILRSWWRNKTFAFISIISISIGLACATLLLAFVIHEYRVEAGNPNKDRILYMSQDSPMQQGEIVSWVRSNIPPLLKEQYAEVEDFLRFRKKDVKSVLVEQQLHAPLLLLQTDASFPVFFPFEVLAGNLHEALTEPDKMAITENVARRLFGHEYPIGQIITVCAMEEAANFSVSEKRQNYTVAAVLKERDQSFVQIEALTRYPEGDGGGVSLLLMNRPVDQEAFAGKLKKDGVPTLQGDVGSYHFNTLKESYFQEYAREQIPFIVRRQPTLLYLSLVSAILILLIACINYVNLNSARFLQQVRTIHIQKLMGASDLRITMQLFADTLLTVFVAFLLSLFIAYDLLPFFNRTVSAALKPSFFFDKQVFPLLFSLIPLLAIIPAFFMGRKVASVSLSEYHHLFTGKQKGRLIASLSVVQYTISIALIIAMVTVNNQVRLIQKGGENYKGLIEIGDGTEDASSIRSLATELKKHPGLQVTLSGGSLLYGWIWQLILKDDAGNETYHSMLTYSGEPSFLKTLQIEILQGLSPDEAITHYAHPIYINQRFADLLVPEGENPIGKSIHTYNDGHRKNASGEIPVIAGVIDNIYTNSLEIEVFPMTVEVETQKDKIYNYLYVRTETATVKDKRALIALIEQEWKQIDPTRRLSYQDVYQGFLSRNAKPIELSRILWMYSLISLLLTCFGLYGMSYYSIRQRTKEIALRKINGASTRTIILLFIRQFFGWIILAFALATPITWFLLNNWLQHYTYRTSISFFTCLISLGIVCLVTMLTVIRHSYQAATTDPVKVLKTE